MQMIYPTLISFFSSHRPTTYGLYRNVVFSLVGWQTLGLALLMALIFYFVAFGAFNVTTKKWQLWTFFLVVTAGLGAVIAVYTSAKQGAVSTQAISRTYQTYFAMTNVLVAGMAFFLWSLLFARVKTDAQNIPL